MRLRSKGLGKLELPMELAVAELEAGSDALSLRGRIVEGKVNWDYVVLMDCGDILAFTRVAGDPGVVAFLARERGVSFLLGLMLPALRFAGCLLVSLLAPRVLAPCTARPGEPDLVAYTREMQA
ncbi:MAG: hypothetical protein H8E45_05980 [Proteobacteria bacterium]|nr:hypothetical protein [Pseudomonadota bacterium]